MTFRQQRYLTDFDQASNDTHEYKWWIPITYDVQGGKFDQTDNSIWLSPNDNDMTVTKEITTDAAKALVINVQQTGYYRVNYDKTNWKLISKAMESNPDSIHKVNRGQALNDAFSLARAGLLNYEVSAKPSNPILDDPKECHFDSSRLR